MEGKQQIGHLTRLEEYIGYSVAYRQGGFSSLISEFHVPLMYVNASY
jgi:hypothetical protein